MLRSANKIVGITLGDPAGIGPQVTAKALKSLTERHRCRFLVLGDEATFKRYFPSKNKNIELYPIQMKGSPNWKPGKPTYKSAEVALNSLHTSVYLIKSKTITSLVTAPLSKESVCRVEPGFIGHTEYFAQAFEVKHFDMMFVTDAIKSVILTRHIPINQISKAIKEKKILETIELTHDTLKKYFKIRLPRIAICGLNPHAGEGGLIGFEETKTIIPAIKKAQRQGFKVFGPFAGDTMFVPQKCKDFDVVISMYHDQGLIAMKTLYFSKVVNLTIGLPFIRTSPAHGTAFDIASTNNADPSSMIEAIKLAIRLS